MFTGIIEEVGKISETNLKSGYMKLLVRADKVLNDLKIDDSQAINGTCQTVTRKSDDRFVVDILSKYVKNFMQKKTKNNSAVNGWLDERGC